MQDLDIQYLFEGMIIGFLISTPIGTVGVLCIRRMLTEGKLVGFISGLGAALADGLYALLAAAALTFVSGIIGHQQAWLRFVAGLFLLYLGWRIFRAHPHLKPVTPKVLGLFGDFASIFLLALSNPMVILSLAAIFKARDLTLEDGGYASVALLAAGVSAGSASWWVLFSLAAWIFKIRFDEKGIRWINRVAGVIIVTFGVVALVSVLFHRH
jgi:threonine/homoserine/homoserine lactone efflux protein